MFEDFLRFGSNKRIQYEFRKHPKINLKHTKITSQLNNNIKQKCNVYRCNLQHPKIC